MRRSNDRYVRLTLLIRIALLTSSLALAACGSDTPASNGDASVSSNADAASMGSPDAAAMGSPDAAPLNLACDPSALANAGCGNSPIGSWTYEAACGTTAFEAAARAACNGIAFRATSHVVTGTLDFTATNYTIDVHSIANVNTTVPPACTGLAGGCVPFGPAAQASTGAPTVCAMVGNDCECSSRVTTDAMQNGTYTTNAGVLTTVPTGGAAGASYNYCVEGGVLRYRLTGDGVVYVLTP